MRPEIEEVKELVIKGSAKKVAKAVQAALDVGCDASEILNQGMVERCPRLESSSPKMKSLYPRCW